MIIHILGPSGSGKTTLANKIAKKYKNTIVVDTDDIDDPNCLKAIKKYSFVNEKKDSKDVDKQVSVMNKNDINKIIKNNKDKNIIFAGFFHDGMSHVEKKVDKGFMIEISPEKLWRQYNLRTATCIHKNFNEIKKLLNSRTNPEKIHMIFCKKFGIRNGFECAGAKDFERLLKKDKEHAKKINYYYTTSNNIYKEISKILS
uniref:AAA domain protein n=1 Tax=Megaviridae environmental sample TaxID=1737588 RepID=A0A5J6VJ69_9VIRU|nr:MAG: hypothetical protein [Megaviridae environmental sample]